MCLIRSAIALICIKIWLSLMEWFSVSVALKKTLNKFLLTLRVSIHVYTCIYRCPQKSGTLDFCYFDIVKYSICWFHQIKHCLLKRMIPRSFDLVRWYWFYNHFLKHSHLRILLNLRELFTAGMAVHKFSLCFVCTDQWASGQQYNVSQKSDYPRLNGHENEDKLDNDYVLRNDHRIKTTQPISMILVSFFQKTIFYLMK